MTKIINNKIIIGLFAAVFMFVGATDALANAVFNNHPSDLDTVRVVNITQNPNCIPCWGTSTTVNPGDVVSVRVYYHNNGDTSATNTRIRAVAPVGTLTQHAIGGSVSAQNAGLAPGTAYVSGSQAFSLTYIPGSAKWYPNQQQYNHTPLPNGQNGSELFGSGVNIGTVAPGWSTQGSVVFHYQVSEVETPEPPQPPQQDVFVQTNQATGVTQTMAILNGTVNGFGEDATAWFRYGTSPSLSTYSSTAPANYGGTQQSYASTISGLSQNTTYYFRACAVSIGTVQCGSIQSFQTDSTQVAPQVTAPTVSTNEASLISTNGATLNGSVNSTGGEAVIRYFKFGQNGNLNQTFSVPGFQQNAGSFAYVATGLQANTTYTFQACAQNTAGTDCGIIKTFQTLDNENPNPNPNPQITLPIVTTQQVQGLLETSAILAGSVNSTGGEAVVRFFKYGQNGVLNQTTYINGTTTQTGSFTKQVANLQSGTTYGYQACAQNSAGQACGSVIYFTTQDDYNPCGNGECEADISLPIVTTQPVQDVQETSAVLVGSVNSIGGDAVVRFFKYGQNGNLNQTSYLNGESTQIGEFTKFVTGLQSDTYYGYQACAQNDAGQACGSTQYFSTQDTYVDPCQNNWNDCYGNNQEPEVFTYPAQNVGETYATLEGRVDGNGSNATRWFQYGTSFNGLNMTTPSVYHGSGNYEVEQYVSGLNANTTYYFRIVAQNSDGIDYGTVKSFTTDGGYTNPCNYGNCYNNQAPTALTTLASGVSTNSAVLNGLAVVNGNVSTNAYFQWSTNASFNNSTQTVFVGSNGSIPVARQLNFLTPGTTYYFRLVVQNAYGTAYGDVKTFTTNSTTVTPPTTGGGGGTVIIIDDGDKGDVVDIDVDGVGAMYLALDITPDFENVFPRDIVNFDVDYENVSTGNLRDVVIRVVFPEHVIFRKSTRGFYSQVDHELVVNVGTLEEDEVGEFLIQTEIARSAINQDVLVTAAEGVHTHPNIENSQASVIAYAINNVIDNGRTNLGALALFSGGFFPTTFLGWLILALIIFFIVLVARRIARDDTQ